MAYYKSTVDDALEVKVQVIMSETGRLFFPLCVESLAHATNIPEFLFLIFLSSLVLFISSTNNLQPILTEAHITLPTNFDDDWGVSYPMRLHWTAWPAC